MFSKSFRSFSPGLQFKDVINKHFHTLMCLPSVKASRRCSKAVEFTGGKGSILGNSHFSGVGSRGSKREEFACAKEKQWEALVIIWNMFCFQINQLDIFVFLMRFPRCHLLHQHWGLCMFCTTYIYAFSSLSSLSLYFSCCCDFYRCTNDHIPVTKSVMR